MTTVFWRAARAEWTRLRSVRSTWWSLLAATGLMLFISTVIASESRGATPTWEGADSAIMPGQLAFLLIVVLAVTGEYSTGAIRSSVQWVPRRGILFAARVLVPVVFAAACAVAVAGAANLVTWALVGDDAEVVAADIARSLGMIALVVAVGGVLSVGFGLFLRSTAGTITAMFLLMLVLPIVLVGPEVAWLTTIGEHLPGYATASLLESNDLAPGATSVVAVIVAWTTGAMLAGGWSLIRRDTI